MVRGSVSYVNLPGGFGTLDELSEALTLMQTRKLRTFPVVLMGTSYWRPLLEWVKNAEQAHLLSPADPGRIFATDDCAQAMLAINEHYAEQAWRASAAERDAPATLDEVADDPRYAPLVSIHRKRARQVGRVRGG